MTKRKRGTAICFLDTWIVLCISILIYSTLALSMESSAETVRVAVCQMRVEDGMISENLSRAETFVRDARIEGAAICVFPELMDVGFGVVVKGKSEARLAFPIPGDTSDKLGAIARKYHVWIVAALLEEVEGGAYDANVIIDSRGTVVHKQRKAFCYPSFAGATSFQGNYQDVRAISSPWGPLAIVNCADTNAGGKRRIIASQQPSLVFINFANPQANLLRNCNKLATEYGCPVVGVNMIFPSGGKHKGGKSLFASASGETLWEGGQTEIMKTWDLTVQVPGNLPPLVTAGDIQTIQLPEDRVELEGFAVDDMLPNGTLSVRWSKVSGPGIVIFEDAGAIATTATFDSPGVYSLQLTADDGASQNSDYVSVNVLPLSGSDPDLVGYWTFDQTTEDQSGQENHATINGKGVYSEDAAVLVMVAVSANAQSSGSILEVTHTRNTDTIPIHEVFEITFQHDQEYDNPFFDVTIEVVFQSPSGKSIEIGGFHYGSS
jgi:predicted amidohydrolase